MSQKEKKHLTLSDRIVIETGLCSGNSLRKIAAELERHPTTISHEIKENRTVIKGNYPFGNDCRHARTCAVYHMCENKDCSIRCCHCSHTDCRMLCERYHSSRCLKTDKVPYVCNRCLDKKLCNKEKHIYSSQHANAASKRRLSEMRSGIRVTKKEKREMDELITTLVKKGQPLSHIYAEHEAELPVSIRTLYNYIEAGEMTIKNIDLRRKTAYKSRKKKPKTTDAEKKSLQEDRLGRTYEDFEKYMEEKAEQEVTEMDTVKGVRERGKRLLTLIMRKNSIMLLFLIPDGKAESVKRIFDYLTELVGIEVFQRLFPIILTDNGSEFKRVDELELTELLEYRTNLFYCDPQASWQKPHIEKNHEYIRYVIPSGKSMNPYNDEDILKLMNHINSVKRKSLGNKSPYELAAKDEDVQCLMKALKMHIIPADDVQLTPDIFKK